MNTAVWSLELGLEIGEVDQAAAVALDRDGLETGQVGRGGIGAVRAVGNQDLGALFAPIAEIGRRHQQGRQLPLGPGRRLQADRLQAGDLGQDLLEVEQDAPAIPEACSRPDRDAARQTRKRRQPLVPLRVVLHRARPERIEIRVDRHVECREVRVVPHDVQLAKLGQRRRCGRDGRRGSATRAAGRAHPTPGKIAVKRPGRLDSKSRGGGSSLYMSFLDRE